MKSFIDLTSHNSHKHITDTPKLGFSLLLNLHHTITQYACHSIYAKPLDNECAYMNSVLKAPCALPNK